MSNPILSSHLLLNYLKRIHTSSAVRDKIHNSLPKFSLVAYENVTRVFGTSYELCAMMVKVMLVIELIEIFYIFEYEFKKKNNNT